MHKQNPLRITKANKGQQLSMNRHPAPSPYFSIINVYLEDINVFARFDEIPSLPVENIKEKPKTSQTDGQREISIPPPPQIQFAGGLITHPQTGPARSVGGLVQLVFRRSHVRSMVRPHICHEIISATLLSVGQLSVAEESMGT